MKHTIITGAFAIMSLSVQAQSNTVSGGGTASGTGGSATYTIGQIDYSNSSGTNGSINEGVQQPYEFFGDAGISEGYVIQLSLYPNPTTDIILLSIDNYSTDLSYQLFDMNGKLVDNRDIESSETQIDMSALSSGEYHLSIKENQNEIKNLKIIKH